MNLFYNDRLSLNVTIFAGIILGISVVFTMSSGVAYAQTDISAMCGIDIPADTIPYGDLTYGTSSDGSLLQINNPAPSAISHVSVSGNGWIDNTDQVKMPADTTHFSNSTDDTIQYLDMIPISSDFTHLVSVLPLSSTQTQWKLVASPMDDSFNGTLSQSLTFRVMCDEVTHSDWYDNSFQYRQKITIDNTKVSGSENLSNFPVLVYLNNIQSASSDGVDILFVDTNDTLLDFEIQQYDGVTGNLISWVNIPTLVENSDTEFYVYYGNDSITESTQSPESVWGDSYEAVWHMENTLDSTSKDHDGTNSGATSTTGKIGNTYDFDGNNDYIALDMSFENTNTLDTMTASAWVKVAPNTGNWSILDFDRSEWFTFTIGGTATDSNKVGFHTTAPSTHDFSGNSIVADGTWHLVHVVYDGTDKIIYIDGAEDARNTNPHSGNDIGQGQSKRYGFIGDGSEAVTIDGNRNNIYFDGMADEIRFSMDVKSIHWIATEWNNQNDPSSFYDTSDVQSVYD